MLGELLNAMGTALSPQYVVFLIAGAALGLAFGVVPGLGGSIAIALLIPITTGWDAGPSFLLMASILAATSLGGAITAILINTPGTAVNVVTLFDGYPMHRNGRGGEAIGVAAMASLLASIIGAALLIVVLPASRQMILAFSYPEILVIVTIGIAMIGAVTEGGILRALVGGCIGVALGVIGRSPVTGERRFTGDVRLLDDGVDLLLVIIAAFALTEAIRLLRKELTGRGVAADTRTSWSDAMSGLFRGMATPFRHPGVVGQGSLIGTLVGIVPAVGGTVAALLSYTSVKQTVRDSSKFGKGDPRGVIASETANDSKDLGGVLPTVMFGLPGTPAFAVMLAAFVMHGVAPGSSMLTDRLDITMTIISGLVIGSVVALVLTSAAAPALLRLAGLPAVLLTPAIMTIAMVGAYSVRGRSLDVLLVVMLGAAFYFLSEYRFSLVAMVIAMSLTPSIEMAYEQTLLTHGFGSIFQRPLTLTMLVVALLVVVVPALLLRRRQLIEANASAGTTPGPTELTAELKDGAGKGPGPARPARGDMIVSVVLIGGFLLFLVNALELSRPGSQRLPVTVAVLALVCLTVHLARSGYQLRRAGRVGSAAAGAGSVSPRPGAQRPAQAVGQSGEDRSTLTRMLVSERVAIAPRRTVPSAVRSGWRGVLVGGGLPLTPMLLAWMIFGGVLMFMLGYQWAAPVFLFLFMAWLQVPWLKLVLTAASLSGLLYLVFSVALGMH